MTGPVLALDRPLRGIDRSAILRDHARPCSHIESSSVVMGRALTLKSRNPRVAWANLWLIAKTKRDGMGLAFGLSVQSGTNHRSLQGESNAHLRTFS